MDPVSPDPRQRKRFDVLEMYDVAISELRLLNDRSVAGLVERLERHRQRIYATRPLTSSR
jgi:hypothetical protein